MCNGVFRLEWYEYVSVICKVSKKWCDGLREGVWKKARGSKTCGKQWPWGAKRYDCMSNGLHRYALFKRLQLYCTVYPNVKENLLGAIRMPWLPHWRNPYGNYFIKHRAFWFILKRKCSIRKMIQKRGSILFILKKKYSILKNTLNT